MEFRVEKKERFRIIGYVIHTTNQKKEGRKAIPALWQQMHQENQLPQLVSLMNPEQPGILGVSVYNMDEQDSRRFDYYIGVSSDANIPEGCTSYEVPAALWAIFPCTKETMGKTQVQAISKWIPKSNYRALNKGYITGRMKSKACDIEYYGEEEQDAAIWIAVEEK